MPDSQPSEPPAASAAVQLSSLLGGVGLLVLGNGLLGTLVGVRAGLEEMSGRTIGLIMSAYFVGYVIGSLTASRLVERVGHIRAFAALASVVSAFSLGFAVFLSPSTWIALRLVYGACFAGLLIIAESWLNASAPRDQRGRILGVYMVVTYAAWGLSQQLLNAAPPGGFVLFSLVSVCLSISLVPVTLTGARVPGVVRASRLNLAQLFVISPLAVVGAFISGVCNSALFGMGPTFAQQVGFSDREIGFFLGAPLFGALALQWPLGLISDWIDRRIVLLACAVCAAVLSLVLVDLAFSGVAILVASFFLGSALMPIYSLCVAHANDSVDAKSIVATASAMILVYGAGSTLGPLSASLLMREIGPFGLFVLMALALGAFAGFAVYRMVRTRAPGSEDKHHYVSVPLTSHAALGLNHRSAVSMGKRAPR